jgi:imidazolonepropionase-like amidohydrolase
LRKITPAEPWKQAFTTVRDLGSSDYTDIAMRNLINMGAMLGPRMFVCGYGISLSRERPGQPPVETPGSADNPDEVMKAVRRQIAAGADVVKMYGSISGFENVGTQQTFTYEEMKAAVDVSHAMGKKIAIHSYGPEGGPDVVRAGADSLEHAVDLDDATLQEMVKRTPIMCLRLITIAITSMPRKSTNSVPGRKKGCPRISAGTTKRRSAPTKPA